MKQSADSLRATCSYCQHDLGYLSLCYNVVLSEVRNRELPWQALGTKIGIDYTAWILKGETMTPSHANLALRAASCSSLLFFSRPSLILASS